MAWIFGIAALVSLFSGNIPATVALGLLAWVWTK